MLAVLAVVWFLVFLPSWMSRSQERDVRRSSSESAKRTVDSALASLSSSEQVKLSTRAKRAMIAKRVTGFASISFIAVLAWSLAIWATTPEAITWAAGSAVSIVLCVAANRFANRSYLRALDTSRRKRTLSSSKRLSLSKTEPGLPAAAKENEKQDSRSWSSRAVPSQIYRGLDGAIEKVSFADVVQLRDSTQTESANSSEGGLASEELDQILRRRRANG
jgi:hypothetical protein